ncbi:S-layer homology domain-containing protein [Paenibacillus puerhi]|uniref:S-layer homology domain-containing protein n=1 Tax=Paenibacillus puerhi TaxID=2692622 RepID=UPI00135B415A|nr:S-layer homology domain-containing protein [Paenibacillus puerhi]
MYFITRRDRNRRLGLVLSFTLLFGLLGGSVPGGLSEAAASTSQEVAVIPTHDAAIDSAQPAANFDKQTSGTSTVGNMNIRRSSATSTRLAYFKFEGISQAANTTAASFSIKGKLNASGATATFSVYGLATDGTWTGATLTGDHAPGINAAYEITGVGTDAFALGEIVLDSVSYVEHAVDVRDFVRQHGQDGAVTFVLVPHGNTAVTIYNMDTANEANKPRLRMTQTIVAPASSLAGLPGDGQAELSWGASADAASYRIGRSGSAEGSFSAIGTAPGTDTSYTDTGLTNGQPYYYTVTAVDAEGYESLPSASVAVTPQSASLPPGIPAGLTAQTGNAEIMLSWQPAPGAISYKVKLWNGASYDELATGVSGTSYTHYGVTAGTSYTFAVTAVGGGGLESGPSQQATAIAVTERTRYPIPAAAVTASSNDGNVEANTVDGKPSTRWSAQGDGQWIRYDLGQARRIGYIGIAFYSGSARKASFDLQVSTDGEQWTTVYSGQSGGLTSDMEAFDFPDVTARYVRYVGYGNSVNDWNSFTELHVYGPYTSPELEPIPDEVIEVPSVPLYTKPGLHHPDGTPAGIPAANPVTGRTLNVIDFGADPADNATDDLPAIQAALDAAREGDEVYFPNGTYNLISKLAGDSTDTHFSVKNKVNLRGESQEGAVLLSYLGASSSSSSRVIKAFNKSDVTISHLTITSTYDGPMPTDPTIRVSDTGGPKYGIVIDDSALKGSSHIVIDHVTIEKFEKYAVRISESHHNVVQNSIIRNATNIGAGGAGYGVSVQGTPKQHRLGYDNDTYFNVVRNNVFEGPYLRHGALVQYYAHNNLVADNVFRGTVYDAIDLHGEDEYLNEISGNLIENVSRGGAIGVGNTGGTPPNSNHDEAGPFNYIHDNTIRNSQTGIQVYMGSPDTTIERNVIENTTTVFEGKTPVGLYLLNAPRTVVRDNVIRNNTSPDFRAVLIAYDHGDRNADNVGAGAPKDMTLTGNTVTGNTYGIWIEAGTGLTVRDNTVQGNGLDYYLKPGVEVPAGWPVGQDSGGPNEPQEPGEPQVPGNPQEPGESEESGASDDSGGDTSPGQTGSGAAAGTGTGAQPQPGSGTALTVKPELTGEGSKTAVGIIEASALTRAFQAAKADASGRKTVTLELSAVPGADVYELALPAEIRDLSASIQLIVRTPVATVALPGSVLSGQRGAAGAEGSGGAGTLSLFVGQAVRAKLGEGARAGIGSGPLLEMALKQGGRTIDWSSPSAAVQVFVPYRASGWEQRNEGRIPVWYIDENGDVRDVLPGHYDRDSGEVAFETTHFSVYGIAAAAREFGDIASYGWASRAIETLAAQGIVKGTSETDFSPGLEISRADYVLLLMRTLKLKSTDGGGFDAKESRAADGEASGEKVAGSTAAAAGFRDISATDYFADAVIAAQRLGIAEGAADGRFRPRDPVTRQELFALTARALQSAGLSQTEEGLQDGAASDSPESLARFADHAEVAPYAREAASLLIRAGMIEGAEGKLHPGEHATRAETAALMHRIYQRR